MRTPKPVTTVLIVLLLLATLAGFTTALRYTIYSAPLGADYYTFYLAGKAVFVEGKNPYSPEVTLKSQMGIYHRPATPQEDQVAYAYPPYALLPILPAAFLPYDWAEAYWLALNILSLALIFILCKPSGKLRIKFLYLLFYPVFFGLILGNFAVSIGTILVFIFLFMVEVPLPSRKVQIAAGILLAWATAKPQFLWFFAAFFVLYSLKHRLKVFLISFFTSLAALIAISFVMVPNWLAQWVGRIFEYAGYVKSRLTVTHLLMQFLPENTALVLTYILAAAAGMLSFWLLLRWWRGQLSPFSILAWAGFTTYL
ncbi:MAG: DUF2029 domain-containing protein, partial [Anaerolineaceae bacterium]|nr:DUF2029 domain-containing protein [Anaerolineaceae bacterium]